MPQASGQLECIAHTSTPDHSSEATPTWQPAQGLHYHESSQPKGLTKALQSALSRGHCVMSKPHPCPKCTQRCSVTSQCFCLFCQLKQLPHETVSQLECTCQVLSCHLQQRAQCKQVKAEQHSIPYLLGRGGCVCAHFTLHKTPSPTQPCFTNAALATQLCCSQH